MPTTTGGGRQVVVIYRACRADATDEDMAFYMAFCEATGYLWGVHHRVGWIP